MNIDGFLEQSLEKNIMKTIEELAELQCELIKFLNKKNDNIDNIIEEIADVKITVELISKQFAIREEIDHLIPIKIVKGLKYLKDNQ